MRLEQYINEDLNDLQLIDFIRSNCKPYLKLSVNKGSEPTWVYSGRKIKVDNFIGTVKKDREPRDTPKDLSLLFDNIFNEIYGIKPRSTSLFCTGSSMVSSSYGNSYVIFPIGNFQYIWSNKFTDLYHRTRSILIQKSGIRTKEVLSKEIFQNYIPDIENLIKTYIFNKRWDDAVRSNSEIMVMCDKYLAVSSYKSINIKDYFVDNEI